ncbi:glucokinase [Legionella rubrilucens]|nr:glucokinase [Legionella rubrilucens]
MVMLNQNTYAIVADIGGTNARFSRVDLRNLQVDRLAVFPCAQFAGLDAALKHYQHSQHLQDIRHAAIAIACPVTSDQISMTNLDWQFSIQDLKHQLQLEQLQVVNDFTATAMSLPVLPITDRLQIGGGLVDEGKPKVVLGAGTGLGVAHLVPTTEGYIPLPGEAGHGGWAAQTEQEWFIQRFLQERYGHVSVERIISGPGLENLYLAIAAFNQQPVEPLTAAEIAHKALTQQSPLACAAVSQFFASLGSFAGDLALSLSTFGGVYIAGGIVPRLLPLMAESEFRHRFEAKGRFAVFNRNIATFVVATEQPGLLGAAVYLKQIMEKKYALC